MSIEKILDLCKREKEYLKLAEEEDRRQVEVLERAKGILIPQLLNIPFYNNYASRKQYYGGRVILSPFNVWDHEMPFIRGSYNVLDIGATVQIEIYDLGRMAELRRMLGTDKKIKWSSSCIEMYTLFPSGEFSGCLVEDIHNRVSGNSEAGTLDIPKKVIDDVFGPIDEEIKRVIIREGFTLIERKS